MRVGFVSPKRAIGYAGRWVRFAKMDPSSIFPSRRVELANGEFAP
jgi:hypothetical protein